MSSDGLTAGLEVSFEAWESSGIFPAKVAESLDLRDPALERFFNVSM